MNLRIVLINWNLKDDTLECLASLAATGIPLEQVLLIDNGSVDGSVAAFTAHYGSQLQIIKNETNRGYVDACNQGIQLALEQEAEWILLLNNDTLVDTQFFKVFEDFIKSNQAYSILAPLIFYHSQPNVVWNVGDHLIPGTLLTTRPHQNKPLRQELPDVIRVDFVTGCAMLVHRRVFERIGTYDRALEMYGEEIDLCMRAKLAGFQLACLPKARLWHKVSLSAQKVSARTDYLRTRNQVYFYRRYSTGLQRFVMFLFSTGKLCIRWIFQSLKGQVILIKPIAQGWRDGWFKALPIPQTPTYGNR